MSIVTVDFDGTLYQGNSFKIMFQVARKKFKLKQWIIVVVGLVKAIFIGILRGKNPFRLHFFKAFAKTFKGKTTKQLDDFFTELVNIGMKDVNHNLVRKIREHQKNGDIVVILSGALYPFLKTFTEHLKLNVHIISTELIFDQNGYCTGNVGQIINGDEKVKKVQEFIKREKSFEDQSTEEIWAYADSESDIPLLNYVQYPIVVNPNNDMKTIAEKNKWPIFAS